MKYISYKRSLPKLLACAAAVVALFTGCSDDSYESGEKAVDGDMVKLVVSNLRIDQAAATRAYENMPENTTFRLYIYETDAANPVATPVKELTYRVTGSGTILCETDNEGNHIQDIVDTDVFLPRGSYDFYAVSPAVKLNNYTDATVVPEVVRPGFQYKHGKALMSSPVKTCNIQPTTVDGVTGFYNLELNPFDRLASRITFTLTRGDKAEQMEIHPKGIRVSNITCDAYKINYFLGSTDLIPMENEYYNKGEVSIAGTDFEEIADQVYFAETQMIPTRGAGDISDVKVEFNLLMNGGNYKKYSTTLPNQLFEKGKSYNYDVAVNVGGIFVTGWTSSSWETVIEK